MYVLRAGLRTGLRTAQLVVLCFGVEPTRQSSILRGAVVAAWFSLVFRYLLRMDVCTYVCMCTEYSVLSSYLEPTMGSAEQTPRLPLGPGVGHCRHTRRLTLWTVLLRSSSCWKGSEMCNLEQTSSTNRNLSLYIRYRIQPILYFR